MEHEEILHRCFRCGFCKLPSDYGSLACPAYLKYRFESFSPGGRMWLTRAWLSGQLRTDARLQEIFFSCATCGNCVEHCIFDKFRESILEAFIAAKAEMVDQGTVPPPVRDYLTRLLEHGNPYKIPQKKTRRLGRRTGHQALHGRHGGSFLRWRCGIVRPPWDGNCPFGGRTAAKNRRFLRHPGSRGRSGW